MDETADVDNRRAKVIETIWLFWGMSLTGLNNGIMGPTVLDLMKTTQTDPSCIQFVFVSQGVGFIVAIATASFLLSYCSSSILLCASLVLGTVTNATIPWSRTFTSLEAFVFFQGLAKGILDFVIVARCTQLWPQNHGFPLQFVATGVATGAVIAPFICEPFLRDTNKEPVSNSRLSSNSLSLSGCITNIHNYTNFEFTDMSSPVNSQIFYPYTIVAAITFPPAFTFLYYYLTRNKRPVETWHYVTVPDSMHPLVEDNYELVIKRRMLFVLTLLFHIPFAGFYLTYSDLLAPYGIKSRLHISSSRMATMTAMFWLMFLVGRVVTTVFSRFMSQFTILVMNSACVIVIATLMVIVSNKQEVYLWLGSCALAFFEAPFLPGALSWLGEYLTLDKSLITLTFVGAGIGELFLPYVAGALFVSYEPTAFMYTILVIILTQTALFGAMYVVKRYAHPIPSNSL